MLHKYTIPSTQGPIEGSAFCNPIEMIDDSLVTRQAYYSRSKSPSRKPTPRRKADSSISSDDILHRTARSNLSMTFPVEDTPRHLYGLDEDRHTNGGQSRRVSSYYNETNSVHRSSSDGEFNRSFKGSRNNSHTSNEKYFIQRIGISVYNSLSWMWNVLKRNLWWILGVIIFLLFAYLFILIVQHVVLSLQSNFYNKPPIMTEQVIPSRTQTQATVTVQKTVSPDIHMFQQKLNNLQDQVDKSQSELKTVSSLLIESNARLSQVHDHFKATILSLERKVENILSTSSCPKSDDGQKIDNIIDQKEKLESLIEQRLAIYDADKLGQPDYASEAYGARIYSPYYSETFSHAGSAVIEIFVHTLWKDRHTPRTMITRGTDPGSCWSMKGDMGFVVIELAIPVAPTEFVLEHLAPSLMPPNTEMYKSTPRSFEILAWLDDAGAEKHKFGIYHYDRYGSAMQIFPVQNKLHRNIKFIELKIVNNYGNTDYTCIYRLRVHAGIPRQ